MTALRIISFVSISLVAVTAFAAPQQSVGLHESVGAFTRQELEQGLSLALTTLEQRGFDFGEGAKVVLEATANCPVESSNHCLRFTYTGRTLPHSLSAPELHLTIDVKSGKVFEN